MENVNNIKNSHDSIYFTLYTFLHREITKIKNQNHQNVYNDPSL